MSSVPAREISVRPPIAFVLSGGASLGAIQVGMLRALYERGIVPDLIIGTSAGALNAAFIASRPQTVKTADELGIVWRGLRREHVFPLSPLAGLRGFFGSRDHLVPDSGLRALIDRHVEPERLEDMPLPLHLVAVDVITGTFDDLSLPPPVVGENIPPTAPAAIDGELAFDFPFRVQ